MSVSQYLFLRSFYCFVPESCQYAVPPKRSFEKQAAPSLRFLPYDTPFSAVPYTCGVPKELSSPYTRTTYPP